MKHNKDKYTFINSFNKIKTMPQYLIIDVYLYNEKVQFIILKLNPNMSNILH